MPMKELQTFTYIMYQENLERERRDIEERKRKQQAEADAARKESQSEQQEARPPQNRAEMLLAAQRLRNNIETPIESSKQIKFTNGEPVSPPTIGMEDLAEFLEDEV